LTGLLDDMPTFVGLEDFRIGNVSVQAFAERYSVPSLFSFAICI